MTDGPRPGDAPGPAPIFVVGSMRSGSTMLRLILDSHPRIAVPGETGFMGGLRAAKDIPQWKFGRGWYERLGFTEAEMDRRLHDLYAGMFERYAAEQGKPRWAEKTPFHTDHVAEMARVFPEAVFVGIVRHPGAVASSLHGRFHYRFPEALDYWSATNLGLVDAAAALGDRFALLRYEDLVADAARVLRALMAFLDEPWSDDLLRHHDVQREKGAPRAVEGSTVTSDPVDPSRAAQWATSLTSAQREDLGDVGDAARFFGYEPLTAAPAGPLPGVSSAGVALARGGDLARARDAWRERLDFTVRPTVQHADADPQELAARLVRTEAALARARSRRAVRVADAVRKVQHGRSATDLRAAWAMVRGLPESRTPGAVE